MSQRVIVSGFPQGVDNVKSLLGEAKMLHDLPIALVAREGSGEVEIPYSEYGEAQLMTVEILDENNGLRVRVR